MREKILNLLSDSNKALSIEEMDNLLQLNSIEETKEFSDALRTLEEEYEIYLVNKYQKMLKYS